MSAWTRSLGIGVMAVALRAVPAGAGEPPTLRTLLDLAGPEAIDPDATGTDIEVFVASGFALDGSVLEDGATLPELRPEALEPLRNLSCGTPVMRAAARLMAQGETRRADLALLLAGPRLSAERLHAVSGEPFVIHYDISVGSRHAVAARDANRDNVPDAIAGLADDLRNSSGRAGELLGWSPRRPAMDVVVGRSTFAEGAGTASPRRLIALPANLRGPARLAAVAHQVAHAAIHDLSPDAPLSWEEAIASFVAETILAESAGIDVGLEQLLPQRHPDRAFLAPGLLASRGDAMFLRFLDAELTPAPWMAETMSALQRHIDAAEERLDPRTAALAGVAEALDETLGHHGWSLAEAVVEYQEWALEQDLLFRGMQVSVDAEISGLPAEEGRAIDEIPAFGQLRFGVQVPAAGGLELAFDSDPRLSAVAVALLDDGTVRRFPVGGRGRPTALSGAHLSRVIVLVQSPQIPAAWSPWGQVDSGRSGRPGFTLSALADPAYPFSLTSFSGEVALGQVTLSWDTSSERDLLGWWVERAVRPAGPFMRVAPAPLPPLSWPGERASYSFVDSTVRPSTRYHYRVQAVTSSGLAETSPTTSIRTLPAASAASR